MKYFGSIEDPNDLTTKQYVDNSQDLERELRINATYPLRELSIEGLIEGSMINNSTISNIGTIVDNTNGRALTPNLNGTSYPFADGVKINISGLKFRVHGWNQVLIGASDAIYFGCTSWFDANDNIVFKPDAKWKGIKIEFAHEDVDSTTQFTSAELEEIEQSLEIYKLSRNTLKDYANSFNKYTGMLPIVWDYGFIQTASGSNLGKAYPGAGADYGYAVSCYDYIPVTAGEILYYYRPQTLEGNFYVFIFSYDSNKNCINISQADTLSYTRTEYEVKEGTSYIRLSMRNTSNDGLTLETAYKRLVIYRKDSLIYDYITSQIEELQDDVESDIQDLQTEIYSEINTISTSLGLHTKPANMGVLNAIRRARQLTDIKWTPAINTPRVSIMNGDGYEDYGYAHTFVDDVFLSTKEYKGIPYSLSSQTDADKGGFLGIDRTLENFITSAYNANSKFGTDSDKISNNAAAFYGGVCVHIVCYAFDFPNVSSPKFAGITGMSKKFDVSDGIFTNLDLCDVLIQDSHVALITDIIRNENDEVTYVEVSEITKLGLYNKNIQGSPFGGIARRKMWAVEDFANYFNSFGVYEYDGVENVTYTPCPYAPMINEGEFNPPYNLPVITDMGNGVYYKATSTNPTPSVKLLIASTDWTDLIIEQTSFDGAFYSERINITGLTEYTYVCDPDCYYKAYLRKTVSSQNYRSASCKWAVMGRTKNLNWSVSNGVANFTLFKKSNNMQTFTWVSFGTYSSFPEKLGKIYDFNVSSNTENLQLSGDNSPQPYYRYTFKAKLPSGVNSFSTCTLVTTTNGYGNPQYYNFSNSPLPN